METKKITIKRAIVLFWKGLTGIIAATAEWFTTILGMRDESRYGKFIRRVVGGSFATLMLLVGTAIYGCIDNICTSTKSIAAFIHPIISN